MKMNVQHNLPAAADVAWRELHSEAYIAEQRKTTGTQGQVELEEAMPDGRIFRRTRVTLAQELPAVAANLLGSSRLSYTLEEKVNNDARQVEWKVIVDKVSNKVKAEGQFTIEPVDANNCRRVVTGEVKVSVPFVGGRIEKGIAAELTKSYDAAAETARTWLSNL